ncbi:hypothetical protein [Pseudonocardia sp.]|uniref:hypothetical protein n=1 Tax=Pseudonocardia sp. TaxID=60912 RepID=UPI003D1301A5
MTAHDHTTTSSNTNTNTNTNTAIDTTRSTAGPISSPMIAALERAWAAIQDRNSDVPPVVIVLGAGSGSGPGLKLGHFAAMRWHAVDRDDVDKDQDADDYQDVDPIGVEDAEVRLPEAFVGGEGLARGPADVLATLLHEAAHAIAHVRGIKDTSRQGRWHNAKFKALAEEVGIEVAKDPRIGWSPTTLPEATRREYAVVVEELGRVLRTYRAVEISGAGKTSKVSPAAVCGCDRKIRVSKSVLAAGPIVCGICGAEFAIPSSDEAEGEDT